MLYCTSHLKKNQTAGAKAPADISTIAKRLGAEDLPFTVPERHKTLFATRFFAAFVGRANWRNVLHTVRQGDLVIVQHPNENINMANHYIDICKKKTGCQFVALIHDMDSIRKSLVSSVDVLERRNETADDVLLRKYDILICHNNAMKAYLVARGFDTDRIVTLGVFDYLHECNLPQTRKKEKRIVVAGNLMKGKCEYLYKLMDMEQLPFSLELFGPWFSRMEIPEFVNYHGVCSPDELPGKLEGSFGLVWDGTEIDCCAGNAGEYIRYNNPHKCSLFIASNMPVIIWKEAALSGFVEENGVGLTVDSILDIGNAIDALSEDDYRKMVENTKRIGELLRKGHYFTTAMKEVRRIIG